MRELEAGSTAQPQPLVERGGLTCRPERAHQPGRAIAVGGEGALRHPDDRAELVGREELLGGEEEIPGGRRDVLEADPACIEGARLELGGRPTAQGERAQRKRDIRRHAAGYIGERGEEALAAAGIVLVAGAPVVPGVVDEVAGIGLVARGERDVATPPELATVIVEAMAPVEL